MKDCLFDFDYDRNGYTPCDDYETCDECAWYADAWYADVLDVLTSPKKERYRQMREWRKKRKTED